MKKAKPLSVFKFADGLTIYGRIKSKRKDGWLVDIEKWNIDIPLFTEAKGTFIDKDALEVYFTLHNGEKPNGENDTSTPT